MIIDLYSSIEVRVSCRRISKTDFSRLLKTVVVVFRSISGVDLVLLREYNPSLTMICFPPRGYVQHINESKILSKD